MVTQMVLTSLFAMGLNANNPDCDEDGFSDGAEVAGATDPLNKNEIPVGEGLSVLGLLVDTTDDSDGDGLSDAEESHIHGTNPSKFDTDSDGTSDALELSLGTDPSNSDSDEDGFSDGSEVAAGTDPLDQNELPE